MKFNFVPCVFVVSAACVMTTTVQWSVAAEIQPEHAFLQDRSLQDTQQESDDTTCDKACEDLDQPSSIQVQVVEIEPENDGLFGSILRHFNGFFDNGSKFGSLMNGFFNLLRRRHIKPRYEINTDVIVPVLSNYSEKAKSLAALIRNESATFEAASDTPDVVKMIFDLSADNMESVASVIDLIVNDMRQLEKIDLFTASCSFGQILTHINDETLTNIVSIAEIIYTKSGNDDMEEMYTDYVATRTSPTNSVAQASLLDHESNHCLDQSKTLSTTLAMESNISLQARIGNLGNYLSMVALPLAAIVGLIILFPISFIVSFTTLVFSIFAIIISLITKQPLFPVDENLDDDCAFGSCNLDELVILIGVLGFIASPIWIPIAIIASTVYFFVALLSPLFGISDPSTIPPSNESPTNMNNDVMQKLSMVLDLSTEHMVDSLKYMYRNEETDEIEHTLNCKITTISCNNDALMAALPF